MSEGRKREGEELVELADLGVLVLVYLHVTFMLQQSFIGWGNHHM